MAKTKQELSTDVLRLGLGVLDALSDPSAEDAALVEDAYDVKRAELIDKGLAYWPNTGRTVEEIPDAVFNALVDIMTEDVCGGFGVTIPTGFDDYGRQVSVGTKGMRSLRMHSSKRPSGEPARAVYF